MGLWKKYRHRSAAGSELKGPLDELAAAGAEVVVFVPRCRSGNPCVEAMLLEGGRIPIKLAEPTPLRNCSNCESCDCEYKRYTYLSETT